MDLDRPEEFKLIDRADMMAQIEDLPDQLERAWKLGMQSSLAKHKPIDQVLIAGMGGSAIGADLLAAYVEPFCKTPITIQRDYDLPGWAKGDKTLVIGSSHSGNTEETLSVFEQARKADCQLFAVTTGGRLGEIASASGDGLWIFEHQGMPRAAVGYSFGLLLSLLFRLDLIPNPYDELVDAIRVLNTQQAEVQADVPVARNPAKRLAGQLVGRGVIILGSGVLAPAGRDS
jgi:glucose/mannose-6-phosphate isomerase